ncbi:MAG TPA: hypothetical protein PLD54_00490 [Candidatus Levybacteria bacterium]|nr:hypothetical protein [Candidatus Levybacteria bacterium]
MTHEGLPINPASDETPTSQQVDIQIQLECETVIDIDKFTSDARLLESNQNDELASYSASYLKPAQERFEQAKKQLAKLDDWDLANALDSIRREIQKYAVTTTRPFGVYRGKEVPEDQTKGRGLYPHPEKK